MSIVLLLGALVVVTATAGFVYAQAGLAVPSPDEVSRLALVGQAYWSVLVLGTAVFLYGARRGVVERIASIKESGQTTLSPGWILPYVLSLKRYRRYFFGSAILYGAFYAVITSMIVYQPTVDFGQAYGVQVPSAQFTPVLAAPLFSPVVTFYIVNHLGMLFIPLTFLLLFATSILVGLNTALAVFAFDSRIRGAGRGWVSGLGAVVGLFTGCPTCAGLFFANFLGGTGAVTFAGLIGYYQPVFIVLSIPVLVVAPYLTSRGLAKVYRDGCVLVKPS
jgi:hypothetical protein